MEQIDVGLIDEFVEKQNLQKADKAMQIDRIIEESAELTLAYLNETEERELEEAIDVLVTVLVYFKVIGASWKEVVTEFERKMRVNLNKPVRDRIGVKVKKE
jgi:phosphoribosyl-ATP pyrophosphohydrolase